MRRPAVITSAVAILAGIFLATAPASSAQGYSPESYSSKLLSLVNSAREQNGLRPLTLASGTTTVAAAWTQHLANQGALSHNPGLRQDLESHGSSSWTTYGENVGEGAASDPRSLFKAYMASPEHRANILDSHYRYVGVAAVFTGSTAWNTFDFVDAYGSSAPVVRKHVHKAPAPAPQPVRHRAPRPTVTKTVTPAPAPAPTPTRHRPVAKHRHVVAKTHHVQVQAVQHRAPARPIQETASSGSAVVASAADPITPATRSGRLVAVALAVLMLAAVARRWTLAAARQR